MSKQPIFRFNRTATMVLAAVACVAVSASAQSLNTDMFGGTNSPNPDTLSVSSTVSAGSSNTGPFGPAYTGTVSLGAGAVVTLAETMNANASGNYAIGESGTVGAGVSGSFSATKTFAGSSLLAGQYYQLTLTKSNASAVSVLSSFNIQLTTVSNGTTYTALDTTNNTGLLGAVNVLNLFGSGNTATVTFQTPSNFPNTPVAANFSGGVSASGINSTFTFTGANVLPVPEPGTAALLGLSALGLGLAHLRVRRS